MEIKKHWCKYFRVKSTSYSSDGRNYWTERCKCGRLVLVDCNYFNRDSKFPIRKRWFDADGNFEKETGQG